MTAIQLYRFVNENKIEWKWDYEFSRLCEDVLIFVNIWQLEMFQAMLPPTVYDDGGIECYMKEGYFCFWMKDICEHCGIPLSDVFPPSPHFTEHKPNIQ